MTLLKFDAFLIYEILLFDRFTKMNVSSIRTFVDIASS